MTEDIKALNFYLVLCKTKTKFKKYEKINKIRNKYIIDIRKMMEENNISDNEILTSDLFKILLLKKFYLAKEKKKDIYYIPDFSITKEISKLLNIKKNIQDKYNFNLLYFYEDFKENDILNDIDHFDITQILKDY
jgi:hypothetical protein